MERPRPRILFIRARCRFRWESEGISFGGPFDRGRTRMSSSLPARRFNPRNQIAPPAMRPGGWARRYMIDRAVTVFPQPDSPTRPRTSPLPMSKSTPSTARRIPREVVNSVLRPRTTRMGSTGLPPCPGIEDVPQAIPEEVDRDGENQEDESRHDHGPWIGGKARRVSDHDQVAEFRDEQVACVEPDEIERREDLRDHTEVEGDLDEDRRERVGRTCFTMIRASEAPAARAAS